MSRVLTRFPSFFLLIALVFTLSACRSEEIDPPDLILHSGKIITLSPDSRIVESLAVRDGKILAIGSNAEIESLATSKTTRLGMEGRTVIPGLIDSHSHPANYGLHLFRPDLAPARNIAEMMEIVGKRVEETPEGEWITNSGFWNETKLEDKRNPTRFDLDPISPDHPVFLGRGHLGIVNSRALQLLGIDESTPSPPGGTIERDEQGRLTGRLYEHALDAVREMIPPPTHEQLKQSILATYAEMAAAGVTSIRSAGASAAAARAFIDLHNEGALPQRTSLTIRLNPNQPAEELEKFLREMPLASGLGDEWLSIWGFKMVADGGSDLAYLREDYVNRPGFRGQLGGTFESFSTAVKLANRYGWRMGIHALGDAGIDFVLDAYEEAHQESSIRGKRWAIEHGYLLQPEHYERLRSMGVMLHPQSWHFYNLRRNFLENYGSEYADSSHPYRALLEEGIRIAGGTDWRLQPGDQFFYIWVAISRQTLDGEAVAPEQALTREEALRFHTDWAAYSTFEEDFKGTLEVGKAADFVVIAEDYLTIPEEEIRNIRPLATYVAGRPVFQAEGLETSR